MSELHAHTVDKKIDPHGVKADVEPELSTASVSPSMFDVWSTFGLGICVAIILIVLGFIFL